MTALSSLLVLAALAGTNDTVLVQFTSQNCTHCQTMQPVLERMAGEGCPVQAIDVDQQPDVARQFNISGVPTFVVLDRGQETGRVVGATSYERLTQLYRGVAAGESALAASSPPAAIQPRLDSPPAGSPTTQPANQPTDFRGAGQAFVNVTAPSARTTQAPQQTALAASVRLKVEDATGFGYGTGTIIDVHDSEALIVTCGHLFRESQGKGRISVDLFAPGGSKGIEAQLIAYDLDRDIALVSIRPGMAIAPAIVAPPGTQVRPQDRVFTVGCDKGADATVRQSQITAVNKYRGKPNFTAAGAPVDGRSGGGLFAADGFLIGICNAADPADDEGLYAALASIHWQLDQIGQSEIYQRGAQAAATAETGVPAGQHAAAHDFAASAPAAEPAVPALAPAMPGRDSNLAVAGGFPAVTPAVYQPAAAPVGVAAASHQTVAAGDDDTEIVFIVRSKRNPQERSEVYVVDQATPDLITRISEAARTTGQQRAAASAAARGAAAGAPPLQTAQRERRQEPPIVRGQTAEY